MRWTAIVPLNYGRDCKTRLSTQLTPEQRNTLVEQMARHVFAQLAQVPAIERICVVAPECPPFLDTLWIEDQRRGLNAELAAAREQLGAGPTLFIHADLPLLAASEIDLLLAAAEQSGAALAPDSAGQGTNALALAGSAPFMPAFGVDSFRKHRALLPEAVIVEREGLAIDIDEPAALALMNRNGRV
jgi:2-phospho-L-lactate guanylyltransferase